METTATLSILAVIATIVLTILAYILIIPDKKRASLKKFGRFLHDWLNFKFLIIEKLIQFFYVITTVFAVCMGFFMLFWVEENYWTGSSEWVGWIGLLIMLIAPILIRLSYELIMMGILIIKNVIQINNKLKDQNQEVKPQPVPQPVYHPAPAPAPAPAPVPEAAPTAPKFCTRCGSHLDENGTCPNCN